MPFLFLGQCQFFPHQNWTLFSLLSFKFQLPCRLRSRHKRNRKLSNTFERQMFIDFILVKLCFFLWHFPKVVFFCLPLKFNLITTTVTNQEKFHKLLSYTSSGIHTWVQCGPCIKTGHFVYLNFIVL